MKKYLLVCVFVALAIGLLVISPRQAAYREIIDSGVFAALTAPTTTTVTTAGTYYPISGTFSNDPLKNFSFVVTPAIRYDGPESLYFQITWHMDASADGTGRTVSVGIKKNTVLDANSIMTTFLKVANEEQALSGTVVAKLNATDTIQLVLTSTVDGDVITVNHFTTTIRPFF